MTPLQNPTSTLQPGLLEILRPVLKRDLLLGPDLPDRLEQNNLLLPHALPPNFHVRATRRVDESGPIPRSLGVDDGCPWDPEAVQRGVIR